MRIGIVAGPIYALPPVKYGGTERVLYYLIKGLKELGHEVILFGTGDSKVDCEIVPIINKATGYSNDANEEEKIKQIRADATQKGIQLIKENLHRLDIIHSHGHAIEASYFTNHPHLHTIHTQISLIDPVRHRDILTWESYKNLFVNVISHNAFQTAKGLNVVGEIYNGLDPDEFSFVENPEDYLSFLGRFSFEKSPHLAIELALAKKKNLKLSAKKEFFYNDYYEKYCSQYFKHDDERIINLGETDDEQKKILVGNAKVNLHPTNFREPFGLTVLESAYCGTPTLAIKKGAMAEVIEDGRTGILVEDFAEGYYKLEECYNLDRKYISERAKRLFNYKIMAKQYELAYENIISIYKNGSNNIQGVLNEKLKESRASIDKIYTELTA